MQSPALAATATPAGSPRTWYWQSREDTFPTTANKLYSAYNKFDIAGSTAPVNCLAASWHEYFKPTGSVSVWAWTGRQCSEQLPFMCKRKREWTGAHLVGLAFYEESCCILWLHPCMDCSLSLAACASGVPGFSAHVQSTYFTSIFALPPLICLCSLQNHRPFEGRCKGIGVRLAGPARLLAGVQLQRQL